MAAPESLGKLCTSLDQMEIGDYIKCVYTARESNVAGEFSHLGDVEPAFKETITREKRDANGTVIMQADPQNAGKQIPVMETIEAGTKYKELPVSPGVTAEGFFYLLKADKGMLIADRMVQTQISWEALNKKDYIYGGVSAGLEEA